MVDGQPPDGDSKGDRAADPRQLEWVLAAALRQLLYYITFAAMFKSAFFAVDVKSRVRETLSWLWVHFHQRGFPTMGNSRAALYVYDAAHRCESLARATAGLLDGIGLRLL